MTPGLPEFPSRQTYQRAVTQNPATAAGSSGKLTGFGGARKLRARLGVSAMSGVGADLQVTLRDSLNGVDWNTLGTFGRVTGVNTEAIDYSGVFGDNIQFTWTVGGTTPSTAFIIDILAEG